MSNIVNTYTCKFCKNNVKYAWILANGVFEAMPDRDEYVIGNQIKVGSKYEVCVQCPKCKHSVRFEYALNGEYIDTKMCP